MFATAATRKATPRRGSTPRKRSKSPRRPTGHITGYSCTLYKDYLVLFGGQYDGRAIQDPCVYNLKTGRIERSQEKMKNVRCPTFNHAALYYETQNQILFLGGEEGDRKAPRNGDGHVNSTLHFIEERNSDGLSWYLTHGIGSPFMPSPVCNLHEQKLYAYQASRENENFGQLFCYNMNQERWRELHTAIGDMRLRYPSEKAMFVQNKLYLFTENVDEKPRGVPLGAKFIEDVYILALSENERTRPEWERALSSGQVPGLMSNISIAQANEVIYCFGLSHEGEERRSVLWAFDTNMEKWQRIQDIGTLTARPNQRAVVYKGKLLIVDWDYANELVQIQYQDLNECNFASPLVNGGRKNICKDKPESFIQEFKNLYDARLFHDVVFEVEGEEIPAHKAILAYRSNYFMKMFTSGMSESHSAKIPIPHMKAHIFKAILQYVYCNEVELDEKLALDLIPVVDEYVMKGLKGLCEKYLCKQLRKDNVVDMLIVADRHEIDELKKACFKYMLKNLGNIDENEEMVKLSKSLFIELLKFSTPGFQQQKNNTKRQEQEEEEKSNFDGRYGPPSTNKSAGFGFGYAGVPKRSAVKERSYSKGKTTSKKRAPSQESNSD